MCNNSEIFSYNKYKKIFEIRRLYAMGDKGLDFKHKEVINICDGRRLGFVQDVCADLDTVRITSIIVPRRN